MSFLDIRLANEWLQMGYKEAVKWLHNFLEVRQNLLCQDLVIWPGMPACQFQSFVNE
jgi:hypothetical protein